TRGGAEGERFLRSWLEWPLGVGIELRELKNDRHVLHDLWRTALVRLDAFTQVDYIDAHRLPLSFRRWSETWISAHCHVVCHLKLLCPSGRLSRTQSRLWLRR